MKKIIVLVGVAVLVFLVMTNLRSQPGEMDEKLFTVESESEVVAEISENPEIDEEEGQVVEFDLRASNYEYDLSEIRVKMGDRVKINLINEQGEHDLVIDELEVKSKILLDNESEVIEFEANEKGIFEYYCSVGEHRQMGMVGNLIVE
jgi:plastocyanin